MAHALANAPAPFAASQQFPSRFKTSHEAFPQGERSAVSCSLMAARAALPRARPI
jgi:hypothetical protein